MFGMVQLGTGKTENFVQIILETKVVVSFSDQVHNVSPEYQTVQIQEYLQEL